jgi:hypothetical protein
MQIGVRGYGVRGWGVRGQGLGVTVLIATLNNIWDISWWSVLLVEETRVLGENHWPVWQASHWQIVWHNVVPSTPRLNGMQTHNVSVIGTDSIGSFKSILELKSCSLRWFQILAFELIFTHIIAVTISFDSSTGELLDPTCTSFNS